jgi:hypothetical protein
MKLITPDLIEIAAGLPKNDGFCWCGHCHHVVKLPQHDIDRLETAFAGGLVLKLKCPQCAHHEVRLKFPQVPRPKRVKPPVDPDKVPGLFAQVFAAVQRN